MHRAALDGLDGGHVNPCRGDVLETNECERRDYATRFGLANRRDALNVGATGRTPPLMSFPLHVSDFRINKLRLGHVLDFKIQTPEFLTVRVQDE
jgi:hypothetical protein